MILLLLLLIIMLHVIHHHWNVSEMNTLDPLHKHVQWSGHGTKKHIMLNLSATKVFRGGAFFIVIVWIIFCENDTVYISIFLKTLWFFIFFVHGIPFPKLFPHTFNWLHCFCTELSLSCSHAFSHIYFDFFWINRNVKSVYTTCSLKLFLIIKIPSCCLLPTKYDIKLLTSLNLKKEEGNFQHQNNCFIVSLMWLFSVAETL